MSGGGFGASRSVCGRRRGVSFGSCFERSGGLAGIAESGSGVAEGILICCCCVKYRSKGCLDDCLRVPRGFHMPAGSSGGVALLSTLMACGFNVIFLLLPILCSTDLCKPKDDKIPGSWSDAWLP